MREALSSCLSCDKLGIYTTEQKLCQDPKLKLKWYTFSVVKNLQIESTDKIQLIDITDKVRSIITQSNTQEGIVIIFAQHTTCSLVISEFEDSLCDDFSKYIQSIYPKGPFKHGHGIRNGLNNEDKFHTPSHIFSSLIGKHITIPFTAGKMHFGTWQRICLVELNGPKVRNIIVKLHL